MILGLKTPPRVGLALGGGAARGAAHIGVIKVLLDNKIPIDYVAATSTGALIGALFCAGMSIEDIVRAARAIHWGQLTRVTFSKTGPISSEAIEHFIVKRVGRVTFDQLKIPLWVIAGDLKTFQEVVIKEGDVAKAVSASGAVSGVYTPVKWGNYLLVDGGTVNNVPADQVRRMGANLVIASDAVPSAVWDREPENVVQVIDRTLDMVFKQLARPKRDTADFVLEPVKTAIGSLELDKTDVLIQMGEEETKKIIPALLKKLGR